MKWLAALGFAAFFCCAAQAAEKLEPTEWRWIEVDTNDGHWRTREGLATVEITGGKLHAALLDQKGDTDPYYDITGSIQMQRPEQNVVSGKVKVTVKRGPTDAIPFFTIEGTYSKFVFNPASRKLYGIDTDETIMLHNEFSMIGITRETKIVP